MVRLIEKVILGVVIVLFIGLNTIFISGILDEPATEQSTPKQLEASQITEEQAANIALKFVGGNILEVERSIRNRRVIYEVDVLHDNVEKEVEIDAKTGEILKIEIEEEDEQVSAQELATISGILTQEQAKQIALKQVPGTVIEMETEREDGFLVYEFTIAANAGDTAEVEINAENGQVLEIEWGEDDD